MRTALTIAGSDSGGGAGIQADLKTFAAHGVYGTSALTAITAQNTLGVVAWEAVSTPLVVQQIEAVLGDIGADAIKIGMLANAAIVNAVARTLASRLSVPIVAEYQGRGGDRAQRHPVPGGQLLSVARRARASLPRGKQGRARGFASARA